MCEENELIGIMRPALDQIAEEGIYGRFYEIAGDKIAIYISHRLSSCKFSDEIVVFSEGTVIQQGSHATLVADVNSKYYELWNARRSIMRKSHEFKGVAWSTYDKAGTPIFIKTQLKLEIFSPNELFSCRENVL